MLVRSRLPCLLVVLPTAVMVLTGCSPQNVTNASGLSDDSTSIEHALGQAREKGYSSQTVLLEDGSITVDDYKKAFENYFGCLHDLGFTPSDPVLNPIDGQILLTKVLPSPSAGDAATELEASCRERHVGLVERVHQATSTPSIEPTLIRSTYNCLDRQRISYTGTETKLADFFPEGVSNMERVNSVSACVGDAARATHPNLPYVAIAF